MSGDPPRGQRPELGVPDGEPAIDPLIGRVIADRYRVDERLGAGGMGAVYRAEHVLMKKPVAVKVLHREMTVLDEVVKRFEREAIAAGRVDHPNVAVATDFGKLDDGSFYLVLEYVPGRSLSRAIEEDGPFPDDRALFVARQVAAGLGAAHAAGIVHRDLKPDNIMLIERGGTKDFVKVLDFGIAKVNTEAGASQLTRLGSVFGTPAYMAPEQVAGQSVDGRADLYSLGLVLYEMLTGKAAFVAEELVQLLTKQLTEPPPPLPETVGQEVAALVMRLLEKDPALRVQSSEELTRIIDARLGPLALSPESTSVGLPSGRGAAAVQAVTSPAALPTDRAISPPASRARALPGRIRARIAPLAARIFGGDTIRVAGRDVPLWLLGALIGALIMGVALTLSIVPGGQAPPPAAPAQFEAAPAADLGKLIARAQEGDRHALVELSARPEQDRTAMEWAAIGKGHSKLLEHAAALGALSRAVALDPSLASDRGLLVAVRRAADDDKTQKHAMEFCAGPLGPDGGDVLFDVWASTIEKTETTTLAKVMLDRESVRRHASTALRIALDLRRTTRCEDVKNLVEQAREYADERAFRPLNQLTQRRGCGFLKLADCYPCLRQGDALGDALKAAQDRKGPRFSL